MCRSASRSQLNLKFLPEAKPTGLVEAIPRGMFYLTMSEWGMFYLKTCEWGCFISRRANGDVLSLDEQMGDVLSNDEQIGDVLSNDELTHFDSYDSL